MNCPGCGYFLPGGQSAPQTQGQPIPQDGCPNCGRPYEAQPSSIESEMTTRNVPVPGGGISAWLGDPGGSPLTEGMLADNGWKPGQYRDESYASIYASVMAPKKASKPKVFDIEASWNDKLKEASDFDITQVIEPGKNVHTVEVDQEGEMNPLILQHDNPEVLDEAKSTLKSSGILDSLLGGAAGYGLGTLAAPFTGGLSEIAPLAGSLLGRAIGGDMSGGGGQQGDPMQQGNNLQTLSNEAGNVIDENALMEAFTKALPALAQFAHSSESGANHPDIAKFTIMFDQAYPGLKDQPPTPEHEAEIDSIKPQTPVVSHKSIYDIIHEAAAEMPGSEGSYGQAPGQKGPEIENSYEDDDIMDDVVRLLAGHPNLAPEDAADIIAQRSTLTPREIMMIIDRQNVNDWQHVVPEARPSSYRQVYEPSDYPPQWGEFPEPPEGQAFSSVPPSRSSNWTSFDDGYSSPNAVPNRVNIDDPDADGIDAAIHEDNPDAWQKDDSMTGGGSDSPYAPLLQEIMRLIQERPDLMPKQASSPINMNPPITPVGENSLGITCPHCGNRSVTGLVCPQCGQPVGQQGNQNPLESLLQGQTPMQPQPMQSLGGVGPHNQPQMQMVLQYLNDNGMGGPGVAEDLINNPDNYADALAAIQQKGTVPDIDPNQPPPPMAPPGPAPGGGAPPGAGGPPGQTQMMQASRTAADNLAPQCPACQSHTTELITEDGDCHCHSCGNKWSMPNEKADTIHSAAQENTWITKDGQVLAPGMQVLMFSNASPIPDEIEIVDVKPNSIVYKLDGAYGLNYETEITRQEAQIDGLTFAQNPSQPGVGAMEQAPPEMERDTNDDNTGFVGPTEGVSNLAVQSSDERFCAHCDRPHTAAIHDAHPELCPTCAFDLVYGDGLNKTAGADYSRSEQLSLINEPGVARNLSDLDISNTHYLDLDEDAMMFW